MATLNQLYTQRREILINELVKAFNNSGWAARNNRLVSQYNPRSNSPKGRHVYASIFHQHDKSLIIDLVQHISSVSVDLLTKEFGLRPQTKGYYMGEINYDDLVIACNEAWKDL